MEEGLSGAIAKRFKRPQEGLDNPLVAGRYGLRLWRLQEGVIQPSSVIFQKWLVPPPTAELVVHADGEQTNVAIVDS